MGSTAHSGAVDQSRFVALLEPVLPRASRLARVMLDGRPEAEDAVQEAVVSAWRHIGSYEAGRPIEAWFLAIVANQCRMHRRNKWWSVIKLGRSRDEAVSGGQPSAAVTDLRLALRRMPHDQRLVLALRYYIDLPFDAIGQTLGISRDAAKSRTSRALKRLRIEIPKELGDD